MSRICYYIPADGYVEDNGYRVSVVTEDEPGHSPTGTWPYEGKPGQKLPYFWGHDFETAKFIAQEQNAKLGISEDDAFEIVTSSMVTRLRGRLRQPK